MKNRYLLLAGLVFSLAIGLLQDVSAEPVEAGFGKIKVNGLMQFRYESDNSATPKDTFYLRRAEIKLSGEIKPEVVSWAITFDPAQVREDDVAKTGANVTSVGRKSVLQNFVITLKPSSICSIDLGQFKVPFGMEGLESSAKLDFIERSALSSVFKWADYSDIGFTLKGDFKVGDIKIQPQAGIFNGEGPNKRLDTNEPVDFVGRLVVKPIEALHLGVAHYNGKKGTTETDNYRTGGEVKFVKDPFSAYGEYVTGKSDGKERETYYLAAGYKILSSLQGVVKYDWYDPDINTKDDERYENTIGLNYFIEKHNAKVQLNYVYRGEEGTTVDNDIIRLNVQISY